VRWSGYGPEDDTWEKRKNLYPEAIIEFLQANDLYDYTWPGARCEYCDKPCKSKHGVRIHQRFCHMIDDNPQEFKGRKAEQKAKVKNLVEQQDTKATNSYNGKTLLNTFRFKYLGSIFAANGDHSYDVDRRIAIAMSRMGQLHAVFNSQVALGLKMRIYKAAVCSLLTYGSEAWTLNEKTRAKINGANARCVSRITGRSIHEEASKRTQTYDLVKDIRKRRFKWLGHLLRLKGDRLVKTAIEVQNNIGSDGNMLMDAPEN
jgi:hypothetical protein